MVSGTDSTDCVHSFLAIEQHDNVTARYKTFPLRCGSWDCTLCAKIKADRYKVRMQPLFDLPSLWMYTFTFYHNKPQLQTWSEVSRAWNRLRTAASKKYGRFSYVRVLEHHHRSNYPHLHVIASIHLGDVWLSKELIEAGFGYQAVCKAVTSSGAAGYISKYLTKPWSSAACRTIRKNLRLRVISFGGNACSCAKHDSPWGFLSMAPDICGTMSAIYLDVEWRYGQSSVKTYEETGFDSYELTVAIPSQQLDTIEMKGVAHALA